MNYFLLILLLCVGYIKTSYGYFYWRDYHDKIPLDAYSAGENFNKEKVYIGQAFIFNDPYQGIYPTSIVKDKDVYVPRVGARKADNFVQILCSDDPDNFEWIVTNSTHFHFMKTDNELVRGGVESRNWVSIGRLRYQGGMVIGKIMSGDIGQAVMWFVYNQEEKSANSYEVLTYNDIASKIIARGDLAR